MDLRLEIKFYTDKYSWLCFRHAVEEVLKGEDVKTEIDNYRDENYLGTVNCIRCSEKE